MTLKHYDKKKLAYYKKKENVLHFIGPWLLLLKLQINKDEKGPI